MACERHLFLMAAPYCLMFRAIALTLRAGLRGLRPPSAPQRRLRDIFLMSRPPLLREGSQRRGVSRPKNFVKKNNKRGTSSAHPVRVLVRRGSGASRVEV